MTLANDSFFVRDPETSSLQKVDVALWGKKELKLFYISIYELNSRLTA